MGLLEVSRAQRRSELPALDAPSNSECPPRRDRPLLRVEGRRAPDVPDTDRTELEPRARRLRGGRRRWLLARSRAGRYREKQEDEREGHGAHVARCQASCVPNAISSGSGNRTLTCESRSLAIKSAQEA